MMVGTFALIGSNLGSRCKRSYKCGNGLDDQLETVSAQIAPGLFRSRDQFASCIEGSRLDCVVCHFYYGQAIESKGAAEH
jgi:hypothetical protein